MAKTLEDLIKDRKELYSIHERNHFTNGIQALLTDLYPDKAHFIYELLQNAEDMNAANVIFELQSDGLWFKHNGSKRTFTLQDIDAITNIGNNVQKKNDLTSIGKFGVGFKAVYAYTSSPEIHSRKFHFRIRNYFIPEIDGIKPIETNDGHEDWTIFYFPFDNPKKDPARAVQEISKELNGLDSSSILFLHNITEIDFSIGDQNDVRLYKKNLPENVVTITRETFESHEKVFSHHEKWLLFEKPVSIQNEYNKSKVYFVSIAYFIAKCSFCLKEQENNTFGRGKSRGYSIDQGYSEDDDFDPEDYSFDLGEWEDDDPEEDDSYVEKTEYHRPTKIEAVPNGGKVFIYFPAVKEDPKLCFHINAPFASTVARDSIRDCDVNHDLIRKIGELAAESLHQIKAMGLMTMDFIGILPQTDDLKDGIFYPIAECIQKEFLNNDFIPTFDHGFTSASNAVIPFDEELTELFTMDHLRSFVGKSGKWTPYVPQRSDAYRFLTKDLDVFVLTSKNFSNMFEEKKRKTMEQIAEKFRNPELGKLYMWLSDLLDNTYRYEWDFGNNLKKCRILRTADGRMMSAEEAYLENPVADHQDLPVLDAGLFAENEDERQKIRAFFADDLKIKRCTQKAVLEHLLLQMEQNTEEINSSGVLNTSSGPDLLENPEIRKHFSSLLQCASYHEKTPGRNFQEDLLFISYNHQENRLEFSRADQIMGSLEGISPNICALLKSVFHKNDLWEGYQQYFTEEEYRSLLVLMTDCGLMNGLTIELCDVKQNPLFDSELFEKGQKETKFALNEDYTIPGLSQLLALNSVEMSQYIWNLLISYNMEASRYSYAKYAPNRAQYQNAKVCKSSLLCELQNSPWIPGKDGVFHRPREIDVRDIQDGFPYSSTYILLNSLEFGSDRVKYQQKSYHAKAEAEKYGWVVLTRAEYQSLQRKIGENDVDKPLPVLTPSEEMAPSMDEPEAHVLLPAVQHPCAEEHEEEEPEEISSDSSKDGLVQVVVLDQIASDHDEYGDNTEPYVTFVMQVKNETEEAIRQIQGELVFFDEQNEVFRTSCEISFQDKPLLPFSNRIDDSFSYEINADNLSEQQLYQKNLTIQYRIHQVVFAEASNGMEGAPVKRKRYGHNGWNNTFRNYWRR